MKAICEGRTTREAVLHGNLRQYRQVFDQSAEKLNVLKSVSRSHWPSHMAPADCRPNDRHADSTSSTTRPLDGGVSSRCLEQLTGDKPMGARFYHTHLLLEAKLLRYFTNTRASCADTAILQLLRRACAVTEHAQGAWICIHHVWRWKAAGLQDADERSSDNRCLSGSLPCCTTPALAFRQIWSSPYPTSRRHDIAKKSKGEARKSRSILFLQSGQFPRMS